MERIMYLAVFLVCCLAMPIHASEDDHEEGQHSICDKMVDVGFIIDSSGSISYHFKRALQLVKLMHEELANHIGKMRAGVMTFSEKVIYYRRLRYYNKNYFGFYLNRMMLQGKLTRLDTALDFALKEFFLVHHGHRPGAIKVAILLTDGRQTTEGIEGDVGDPASKAKHIREDGINLIVIGIVDVDRDALEKLDAGMNQLIYAGTLQQDLDGVLEDVPHKCRKAVCQIEYEPEKPTCGNIVDVVFVVDSSGSLRGYFDAEKYFVNTVAEQFNIGQQHSQVAFVRFSHIVHTEIHFKDFTDMHDFRDAVDGIFYDGGLTRIDLGLRNAELEFTNPAHQSRLNNPKIKQILVLLTDGRQLDTDPNPAIIAKRLRDIGVDIVVLGVGKTVDAGQMQEIAGPGIKWYEHHSFDQLINIHNIERIRGVTCHGHGKVHGHDDEDHEK